MDTNMMKSTSIEQINTVYAISSVYLRTHDSAIIKEYLESLKKLEDLLRSVDEEEKIKEIVERINVVIRLIEVIIYE